METMIDHRDEGNKVGNCLSLLSIPLGQYYDVALPDWSSHAPNDRESHQSGIDTPTSNFLLPRISSRKDKNGGI